MRIVLITSGQPSTNPRLVKEADALAEAGYVVTVIYQYVNRWATEADKSLLKKKPWKAIEVGGNPITNKLLYNVSRLLHKAVAFIARKLTLKFGIAELAIARGTFWLSKEAKRCKADFYIAHNLAALPSAAKAAQMHHAKLGFDAEDFHRQETTNDQTSFDYKLKAYLEDIYIPQANYVTAASPLIALAYGNIFQRDFTTILNAFEKKFIVCQKPETYKELKLFWFSQTIGKNRGLEDVIAALGILQNRLITITLLGNLSADDKNYLEQLAQSNKVSNAQLIFVPPIDLIEIFALAAEFDVGLALEPNFSLNNNFALSNKILTYLTTGLAIIASETDAQKEFMNAYPSIGKTYPIGDVAQLAAVIKFYFDDRTALNQAKEAANNLAEEEMNWELESKKFLAIVERTLAT